MKQKHFRFFAIGSLLTLTAITSNLHAQNKNAAKPGPLKMFQGLSCSTVDPRSIGLSKDGSSTNMLKDPRAIGLPKDTSKTRALADDYFLWDVGKTISVKFMDGTGSAVLRQKVKAAAKEWEKYANLTFDFVESGDANVRILLTDKGGCNSMVGSYATGVPADKKTMNIDTNFFYLKGVCYDNYLKQTIQHEFGHAIGLLHEHSYKNKIQWNKEVVYKDALETNGWDKTMVDFQIFSQYSTLYTNGFMYDPKSIMHYGFPAKWTLNNVEIKPNFYISQGDIETVGFLYPKNGASRPEMLPRFNLSNLTATKVVKDNVKKGLVIYPSFNLSTSGRTGKILIIAYLLDAKGNTIISKANPSNLVGAVKGGDLKPGTKLNINKGESNFELLIPFSEVPDNLMNYKIFVSIKMIDEVNDETKYLASDEIPYSAIK